MRYNLFILLSAFLLCSCNLANEKKNNTSEDTDVLIEAYKNRDWEKVLSICDTLYNEDDTTGVALLYSEALTATGNIEKAIIVLDRKIAQDPNDYYAIQSKGNTYNVAEVYDSAIYYYDRVIKIRPTYARPYINKGSIYERIGNNEKAVSCYLEAVHLFAENKFWEEVYLYSKRILELDPTNSEATEYLKLFQESHH